MPRHATIDIIGQQVEVTFYDRKHDKRCDGGLTIAGRWRWFRTCGWSDYAALEAWKAEVTRARDAAVVRELAKKKPLHLVQS